MSSHYYNGDDEIDDDVFNELPEDIQREIIMLNALSNDKKRKCAHSNDNEATNSNSKRKKQVLSSSSSPMASLYRVLAIDTINVDISSLRGEYIYTQPFENEFESEGSLAPVVTSVVKEDSEDSVDSELWTDPIFPPCVTSIDGHKLSVNAKAEIKDVPPHCFCDRPAKLCKVNKDGINQGIL